MKIAHLTDLHLDGSTRRHDAFVGALHQAASLEASYLVLTGDLTATGHPEQFHELAWALNSEWKKPATIVRGNHDGPGFLLSTYFPRWVATSRPGVAVHAGHVTIIPVDTFSPKRSLLFRALGRAPSDQLTEVVRVARTGRTTIVAMHHGCHMDPIRKFAGLTNRRETADLFANYPNIHVLCGHDHALADHGNVHVARSCGFQMDPLRIYEATEDAWMNWYPKSVPTVASQPHLRVG